MNYSDNLHVLCAEPDVDTASRIAESLQQSDISVKIVHTIDDLCIEIRNNTQNAILLSSELCDGTLSKLPPETSATPLIYLANSNNHQKAAMALQNGANEYLLKDKSRGYLTLLPTIISTTCNTHRLLHQASAQQLQLEYYARELEKRNESLKQLAYFDTLTGLVNRSIFSNDLKRILAHAERHHEPVGLLYIALDKFKDVNDTYSHQHGDDVLRQFAGRLRRSLRESDTIARLGGDEFAVIMERFDDPADCGAVARKILSSFQTPFVLSNEAIVYLTASIGIALYSHDNPTDAETLVKHASSALYHAKSEGRDHFMYYTAELDAEARAQLTLEHDIREAISDCGFELHYQPLCSSQTQDIIGAEALIRWNHPVRGPVSPAEFIPLAERSGVIIPISEWVLSEACMQCAMWHKAGFPISISVNISPKQFSHRTFIPSVKAALKQNKLPPEYLSLEVTEGSFIQDINQCQTILKSLADIGVQISIDDFGTGFSSLSYLKHLPLNTLKIDQSFVRDMHNSLSDQNIVRFIVALGHSLDLKVVAEGAEEKIQCDLLQEIGCDIIQGYYFSRPLPNIDFLSLIKNKKLKDV